MPDTAGGGLQGACLYLARPAIQTHCIAALMAGVIIPALFSARQSMQNTTPRNIYVQPTYCSGDNRIMIDYPDHFNER